MRLLLSITLLLSGAAPLFPARIEAARGGLKYFSALAVAPVVLECASAPSPSPTPTGATPTGRTEANAGALPLIAQLARLTDPLASRSNPY